MYQGKYKGRLVAIKVVRLYDCNDRDVDRSVSTPFRAPYRKPAPTSLFAEILQRGGCVETLTAPECSTVAQRDTGTK